MKKVSFSVSSSKSQSTFKRPSSSATHDDQESREFITELEFSKAPSSEPSKNRQNRIIPPKPNEWMPFQNLTNRNLSLQRQLGAESSADPSFEGPISNALTYGLNLRSNDGARVEQNPSLMSDVDRPLIKLREDLRRLPEINGFDEFEDMPVEEFGRALLAGYGWVEGMGIGRNAKKDVKVVECKKWSSNEGLGFIRIAPKPQD